MNLTETLDAPVTAVLNQPNLISFWDFQEAPGQSRHAQGSHAYELAEGAGKISRVAGGVFGDYAAQLNPGDYFFIPRSECPALNLSGPAGRQTNFPSGLCDGRRPP